MGDGSEGGGSIRCWSVVKASHRRWEPGGEGVGGGGDRILFASLYVGRPLQHVLAVYYCCGFCCVRTMPARTSPF